MRRVSFIVVMICASFSLVQACLGPVNIEGMAFTSGESINLQTLMNLGLENVNYLKETDTSSIGIRYKSHYDTTHGMSVTRLKVYGAVVRVESGALMELTGVSGCSVVKPGSGAPPASLGTTAVAPNTVAFANKAGRCPIRQLGDGGLIVFLPQGEQFGVVPAIFDCKGAVVRTKRVPAGVQSLCINGLTHGHFTVRVGK